MRGRFEDGCLYKIKFHDHCVGIDKPVFCEAVGWVVDQTKNHITLAYWKVQHPDEDVRKDNQEVLTVVKSCIVRKRKII